MDNISPCLRYWFTTVVLISASTFFPFEAAATSGSSDDGMVPWWIITVPALLIVGLALGWLRAYRAALSLDDARQLLEERLRALEEQHTALQSRHTTLTENLAAAVVLRDASHRIVYCSPYTEVLTGYATRDILSASGDFFESIVPESDRERYQRAFRIGALGEAFQVRHRLIHHSGLEMWVETRTVPIFDAQGELIQSLSVTIDVTGAVRYQRQVEEKNRDLQDFAYMVSHDLKGPLATVKGMLHVLEEDIKAQLPPQSLPSDVNDTLTHIRSATVRLEQLVAGVLEYSKIGAKDEVSESIDLSAVLRELTQHLSPTLHSLGAELSLPSELPTVVGEHVWLYQIFSNLLGNAIKYRDPARPLRIEVTARMGVLAREVVVAVKDNGLGIPKDKLDDIFRPFHRAHGKQIEGTGIGLASVKRMLEKCGGAVRVESETGVGSTFFVTLRVPSPATMNSSVRAP